jgi:hypothetical protein
VPSCRQGRLARVPESVGIFSNLSFFLFGIRTALATRSVDLDPSWGGGEIEKTGVMQCIGSAAERHRKTKTDES